MVINKIFEAGRSSIWNKVELRDSSVSGYEFGSRGTELSRDFGNGSCRIMARHELDRAKKTSYVI
jgi:hypothetical protein